MRVLSHLQLFAPPWTVACQSPLTTGFSRQEYWSRLPFSIPEDLPVSGVKPSSPVSPALADSLPCATWEAFTCMCVCVCVCVCVHIYIYMNVVFLLLNYGPSLTGSFESKASLLIWTLVSSLISKWGQLACLSGAVCCFTVYNRPMTAGPQHS